MSSDIALFIEADEVETLSGYAGEFLDRNWHPLIERVNEACSTWLNDLEDESLGITLGLDKQDAQLFTFWLNTIIKLDPDQHLTAIHHRLITSLEGAH